MVEDEVYHHGSSWLREDSTMGCSILLFLMMFHDFPSEY
jgi:hypothetical protein